MKTRKQIKNTFEEILSSYFSKEERKKFDLNLAIKYDDEALISEKANSSLDKNSIEDCNFAQKRKFQIESLLTYLEDRVSGVKYYDLLMSLGKSSIFLGENFLAITIYQRLINEVIKDDRFVDFLANAYLGLSEALSKENDWNESVKYCLKANTIFSNEKDFIGMSRCENLLGVIYGEQGDFSKAESHLSQALELLNLKSDKYLRGMVEINLGILNFALDNYNVALTYFQRALTVFEQFGDFGRIAEVRYNMGILYAQKTKYEEALIELDFSIASALKAERLPHLGKSYLSKAGMFAELDKYPLAIAYANKAMDISYRVHDSLSIADIYKIKGIVHRKLKNKELSENYLLTSLRLNKDLKNMYNYAETSLELGLLYKDWDKTDKSLFYLNDALEYNKRIGAWQDVKRIQSIMSEINIPICA